MLLSYEVAFDSGFNYVLGGKLPGFRGGPDPDGCSGGNASTGANCFSSRLMWRKNGQGEGECRVPIFVVFSSLLGCSVYVYIPETNEMCSMSNFMCNSDGFGTSIDRGSFSFVAGQ